VRVVNGVVGGWSLSTELGLSSSPSRPFIPCAHAFALCHRQKLWRRTLRDNGTCVRTRCHTGQRTLATRHASTFILCRLLGVYYVYPNRIATNSQYSYRMDFKRYFEARYDCGHRITLRSSLTKCNRVAIQSHEPVKATSSSRIDCARMIVAKAPADRGGDLGLDALTVNSRRL
jgi:hypothetical protein